MATTCPVDLDTARLRHEIRAIYARVASDPMSEFHFHRGPAYAAERLVRRHRARRTSIRGDGFMRRRRKPSSDGGAPAGATVVDIGCGAGMD